MRPLSTTAPFGFEFDTGAFLALYREIGCRQAEFYRNTEVSPPLTPREALRTADDAGVRFDSLHGVFGWRLDPSSPDRSHRDWCLGRYEQEGRLARDLGGPMVVVHPSGNYQDQRPRPVIESDAAQASRWTHFDDFARRLAAIGERLGVTYLIENVPRTFPLGHDPGVLGARVEAVASKRLRMCFDVGHAHITGDACAALRDCAGVVSYIHLHDNDGREDSHWMPGDGTVDWTSWGATVRDLSLDVPMMMEVFYDLDRVRAMLNDGLAARIATLCGSEAPAQARGRP